MTIAASENFESTRLSDGATLPFLKWAGGKRWLTSAYANLFPDSYDRYVEPFLGSAAVFFSLKPRKALLSDSNADLINVYKAIRRDWRNVARALRRHHQNHDHIYYYEERARKRRSDIERGAQLIYLNRVCWNGLYRVNLNGEFNVPLGTKTSVCLETDDFEETACLLRRATIRVSDFEAAIEQATENDFVFVDPPYVTRHNFNGFAKYNEKIFSWPDQERLQAVVSRAASRGVKILVTNADHASIRELYRGIGNHMKLTRHSVLAAASSYRGLTSEIAIAVNYVPSPAV